MNDKIIIVQQVVDEPSNIRSHLSWNNIETKKALKKLFHLRKNETISQIEVDDEGIIAHIYVTYKQNKGRKIKK